MTRRPWSLRLILSRNLLDPRRTERKGCAGRGLRGGTTGPLHPQSCTCQILSENRSRLRSDFGHRQQIGEGIEPKMDDGEDCYER